MGSLHSAGVPMRSSLLASVLLMGCFAQAQLGDILKKADETLNQRSTAGLSNDKIIAGLKQALQVSTGKAVALYDDKYATMTQSFGPEARGGACQ